MYRVGKVCVRSTTLTTKRLEYNCPKTATGEKRNFFNGVPKQTLQRNDQQSQEKSTTTGKKAKQYDEEICITGISGRFPQSDSVEELGENLFKGVDMVIDQNRWPPSPVSPKRYGFLKNVEKFDAEFFGINQKLADTMDPQTRKLMEVTFEAMVDAGFNPQHFKGTKTGVFASCVEGVGKDYYLMNHTGKRNTEGYSAVGIPNFFVSNRISYTFDLKGPSMTISTGCSASLVAMEAAVASIRNGTCEAAIVAGTAIHNNPLDSVDMMYLGGLSPEGKCRTFDDAADGFVRSEAIVAVLIQKKADARKEYATIRGIKSNNDGFKGEGIVFPSGKSQEILIREIYEEAGVDPGAVKYIEAHGTGTPVGDPEELNAIHNVFCKAESRKEPLLVGSVKSSIGHTESAAGLSSLAKILVAVQNRAIPANLHFNTPNTYIRHLFDGTLKVVTETTPFDGGFVGISSFGMGGTNAHVVLETGTMNHNTNNEAKPLDMPVLLPFAGRTEESVEQSLEKACSRASDRGFTAQVQNVFKTHVPGYNYRGFGIARPGEEEHITQVQKCDDAGYRPVWCVFPGMGSQWNEMGKDLMKFDAYLESYNKSKATLKNAGVDLDNLLRPGNPTIFSNIRHSLVAITAVQIALYDTLKSLGLKPEGFVGHSSGEILCAYADGCLNAEETLLVGDARGRAFTEVSAEPGGMCAIGLSWEEILKRCPSTLYPACHNAADNVSVSGPLEDVRKFIGELQKEGIFAKEVNSCNCAPHSPFVYPAGDKLFRYMNEIYGTERPRTSRWISSSIPESEWDTPLAQSSSPAYHVNNMGRPVLFYEALQHIPETAVVIEVAPHGLFQAILKPSLSKDNILVAPMHSMVEDRISYFLTAIGKIHNAGVDVDISQLYPKVNLPLAADTQPLNSLVTWDHSKSWLFPTVTVAMAVAGEAEIKIDIKDSAYSYLHGHKLDNRTVFPATGYVTLAWEHFAHTMNKEMEELPVVFENVSFERATFLADGKPVNFAISMLKATGKFEIREQGVSVAKGSISSPENIEDKFFKIPPVTIPENPERLTLTTDELYKELKLRGYNYSGEFRGIKRIDNGGSWSEVKWTGNWTSFLDTVVHTVALSVMTRNTAVPVRFESIVINPVELLEYIKVQKETQGEGAEIVVPISIHPDLNTLQGPGIQMRGMFDMVIPKRRQDDNLSIDEYNFTSYFDAAKTTSASSWKSTAAGLLDIVMENSLPRKIKIVDAFSAVENSIVKDMHGIVTSKPRRSAEYTLMSIPTEIEKLDAKIQELGNVISKESVTQLIPDSPVDLVFSDQSSILEQVGASLNDAGFVILRTGLNEEVTTPGNLMNVSTKMFEDGNLFLFRKKPAAAISSIKSLSIDNENFDYLPALQSMMEEAAKAPETERFYLTSQNDPISGIVGLTKCLRQEPGGDKIRCVFDPEGKLNLDFAKPDAILGEILEKDLMMNIWKNGTYGSYRHVPLPIDVSIPSKETAHAYINTLTTGDLTSLRWIESPLKFHKETLKKPGEKLYNVSYASVNFRDIMLATGKLPIDSKSAADYQDCVMGYEFSGHDLEGKRVMGLLPSKGLASSVACPSEFVFEFPEHWSLEDAATVPVIYATCYYALFGRAGLSTGQSILIHSGTGGVGQAAIQVALSHGCEVFTTVGSEEKRKYIKERFPALKDENIGNSRDCSFEPQILRLTKGRGVDVVLNSLAEDKLQASIRCLAFNGKFLDIGAFDAFQNNSVGLGSFLKNVELQGIHLTHIFYEHENVRNTVKASLLDGMNRGVIQPIPRTVFQKDQIEEAFRYMASGKHMGKVIIKVAEEDQIKDATVKAIPRTYFNPEKTYVVLGGLGGLGLEVADWLVNRGAEKLVLVSRSGVTTGYQDLCMRKWEDKGIKVSTPKIDISSFDAAEKFITNLEQEGSIGGIFNSTLVLKDGMIEEQTVDNFKAVTAPKMQVTKNLDKLTRQHCKDLDYFVVFSSAACGRGNVAQSNYGLANSVMEQICEMRKNDGLPGMAIQWGVIGEVGFVAEHVIGSKGTGDEDFEGTRAQRVASCLDVLDLTLQQDKPVYSSLVLTDTTAKKLSKMGLIATMQHMFGMKNIDKIKPTTKLIDLGMDSLLGMELKQMLEREYDLPFTPNELRAMTLADLQAIDAGTFVKGNIGKSGQGSATSGSMYAETMVKLHTGELDEAPPLFMVHGIEGHCGSLTNLATKLKVDAYGFQFPGNLKKTQDIAKVYLEQLKLVQAEGPYNISGYSSGCTVAFEMAMQLQNEGHEVANLFLLDGTYRFTAFVGSGEAHRLLFDGVKTVFDISPETEKKYFESLTDDFDANAKLFRELVNVNLAPTMSELFNQVENFIESIALYKAEGTFNGKIHVIRAATKSGGVQVLNDEKYYNEENAGQPLELYTVPGDHHSFLDAENVDHTADILNSVIEKMDASSEEIDAVTN